MKPPHNAQRGEIAAYFSNKPFRLCLTLGALAELESRFEAQSLLELAERFSSGNLKANDLIAVIGAGLRGANHAFDDEEVSRLTHENGAIGFAKIATELLNITFGGGEGASQASPPPLPNPSRGKS